MNASASLLDDCYPLVLKLHAPEGARSLLVLLHGVGGNEDNLAGLVDLLPNDMAVALVRGPLTFGPSQYAWFRVAFTAEGPRIDAIEAERSRRLLLHTIGQLREELGIPAEHTTIAGFSQGGIMSASVAMTEPDQARSFAVLAGRILPEIVPLIATEEALRHTRAFIGHGRFDQKLPVAWAERARDFLNEHGVQTELQLYRTEHALSREMEADFLRWLSAS